MDLGEASSSSSLLTSSMLGLANSLVFLRVIVDYFSAPLVKRLYLIFFSDDPLLSSSSLSISDLRVEEILNLLTETDGTLTDLSNTFSSSSSSVNEWL